MQGAYFTGLTSARPVTQTAALPVTIDLVKKIGHAFIYLNNQEDESKKALVELDETDLLSLRELSQSYIKISEENVGINLKRKVLKLLLEDSMNEENKKQSFRYWFENISKENNENKITKNKTSKKKEE